MSAAGSRRGAARPAGWPCTKPPAPWKSTRSSARAAAAGGASPGAARRDGRVPDQLACRPIEKPAVGAANSATVVKTTSTIAGGYRPATAATMTRRSSSVRSRVRPAAPRRAARGPARRWSALAGPRGRRASRIGRSGEGAAHQTVDRPTTSAPGARWSSASSPRRAMRIGTPSVRITTRPTSTGSTSRAAPSMPLRCSNSARQKATSMPSGDREIDDPVLDVGLHQRARRSAPCAAQRDHEQTADGGGRTRVDQRQAGRHIVAAAMDADAGVDQGDQGDDQDQSRLDRVDQRLELQVAERIVAIVRPLQQARHAQRGQRRHEEAEVEGAVEQDRARAGSQRTRPPPSRRASRRLPPTGSAPESRVIGGSCAPDHPLRRKWRSAPFRYSGSSIGTRSDADDQHDER